MCRFLSAAMVIGVFGYQAFGVCPVFSAGDSETAQQLRVDFSYATAPPHRFTVARPDSSNKTLVDVYDDHLGLSWAETDLTSVLPPGRLAPPQTTRSVSIAVEIEGRAVGAWSWTRCDACLPVLVCTCPGGYGSVTLELAGGKRGTVCRVQAKNADKQPRTFTVRCTEPRASTKGQAMDHLLVPPAGGQKESDRVLLLGQGTPGPSYEYRTTEKGLALEWKIEARGLRTGYFVLPYRANSKDLPALRTHDWAGELASAKKEWHELLARAVRVKIPDAAVHNALYACLADNFVMREPMADGSIAGTAGTEMYRACESFEPALAVIGMDWLGLHQEAESGFTMNVQSKGDDGRWAAPGQWDYPYWFMHGSKAWAVMEHYAITRDRAYLAKVYPQMLSCSRWHERQRAKTRVLEKGKRPLGYGLLVGGIQDCALAADPSGRNMYYGHNVWPVYQDRSTLEVAEILGKTEDLAELRKIYEQGLEDLMRCLQEGSIRENGYRWIPGLPGHREGSQWGALHALWPCRLLPPDHDLVTGSVRFMDSHRTPGGVMSLYEDGNSTWTGTTLDHLAAAHLVRGEGDRFAECLYAVLNYGTPLFTWCEIRPGTPGTPSRSGDKQHLYTPAMVVLAIRNSLVMEDGDGLHLARGTARQWLASGKPVGIEKAPTHFGCVSYQMQYDAAKSRVVGEATFAAGREPAWAELHVRLPGKLRVKSVDAQSGATVLPGAEGVRWNKPCGTVRFEATVGG